MLLTLELRIPLSSLHDVQGVLFRYPRDVEGSAERVERVGKPAISDTHLHADLRLLQLAYAPRTLPHGSLGDALSPHWLTDDPDMRILANADAVANWVRLTAATAKPYGALIYRACFVNVSDWFGSQDETLSDDAEITIVHAGKF